MPPLKPMVAPVLFVSVIAPSGLTLVPIAPVKELVPPVMLVIETTVPVASLIAPSSVKATVPPFSAMSAPLAFEMVPPL